MAIYKAWKVVGLNDKKRRHAIEPFDSSRIVQFTNPIVGSSGL